MKKTREFSGLSPNQEKIMSILEYKKMELIPRKELISLIKFHIKIKDVVDLIEKLQAKKRIVSIKRGVYMVIPLRAIDKKFSLDNYQLVDYLLKEDYYIGLYNAFNLHGFTEQCNNPLLASNQQVDNYLMKISYQLLLRE